MNNNALSGTCNISAAGDIVSGTLQQLLDICH